MKLNKSNTLMFILLLFFNFYTVVTAAENSEKNEIEFVIFKHFPTEISYQILDYVDNNLMNLCITNNKNYYNVIEYLNLRKIPIKIIVNKIIIDQIFNFPIYIVDYTPCHLGLLIKNNVLGLSVEHYKINTENIEDLCQIKKFSQNINHLNLESFIIPFFIKERLIDIDYMTSMSSRALEILSNCNFLTNLLSFNFSKNYFSQKSEHYLCKLIDNNPCITDLDLSYHYLKKGGNILATSLSKLELRRLKINTSNKDNAILEEGIFYITRAIKNQYYLTELNLSNCSISINCFENIKDLLKINIIKKLDLSCNKIGNNSKEFSDLLIENSSLDELILDYNYITDNGMFDIITVLKNKFIKNLSISHNIVGLKASKEINNYLNLNKYIRKLNINVAEIDHQGAFFIGESLRHNNSILTLNMMGNDIGEEGAKSIINGLKENFSIKELDISENGLFQYENILEEIRNISLKINIVYIDY